MRGAKWLVIFVVAILLFSYNNMKPQLLAQTISPVTDSSPVNTPPAGALIVPDEYPTIQDAVGNASAGGTVFVKEGTYYVNASDLIVIDKPLSLIGQDSANTIIDTQPVLYGGIIISVNASNVTVSGFTITFTNASYSDCAIDVGEGYAYDTENCKIIDNTIVNNIYGIWVYEADNFVIENNDISDNSLWGIMLYPLATNGTISGNTLTDNGLGQVEGGSIYLYSTANITLANNTLTDGYEGITMAYSGPTCIYGNSIKGNQASGISLDDYCNNSTVYGNNIEQNAVGVFLSNFDLGGMGIREPGNMIFGNNLLGNSKQAVVDEAVQTNFGTDIVSWDNGKQGNYWSDYQAKYPNGTEVDASGVENTPYVIDENNTDHYPLTQQFNISTTALATTDNGEAIELPLGGSITSSQMSDVAIATNQTAKSTTLFFTVTGDSGTAGFSNITIPISAVPYGTKPTVYFDGKPDENQGYAKDGDNYYVWYTTVLGTHQVSILFTRASSNLLIDAIYGIVAASVAAAAIGAAVLVSKIAQKTKTQVTTKR